MRCESNVVQIRLTPQENARLRQVSIEKRAEAGKAAGESDLDPVNSVNK